jgi:hypothetical protein
VTRTLRALVVALVIGTSPVSASVCTWSCATEHGDAVAHHECEPTAPAAVQLAPWEHCDAHSDEGDVAIASAASGFFGPTYDALSATMFADASRSCAVSVVRDTGPPLPQRPSILRI